MQRAMILFMTAVTFQAATFASVRGGGTDDVKSCFVYSIGSNSSTNVTPSVAFRRSLTISFYDAGEGEDSRAETMVHLNHPTETDKSVELYINKVAEMVVRKNDKSVATMKLPPFRKAGSRGHRVGSWWTLVIGLHDKVLVVYSQDDPLAAVLSVEVELEGSVTSFVSSSTLTHLVFDCPTGCHIHSGSSPLAEEWLPLPLYLNLYFSPLEGSSSNLRLEFSGKRVEEELALPLGRDETAGLWYRAQMVRAEGQPGMKLVWDGEDRSIDLMSATKEFKIKNAADFLFSLYCYPDVARGLESWLDHPPPRPSPTDGGAEEGGGGGEEEEKEEDAHTSGVGKVVVWAWVLAGLAFFLVMVLAMALCTKMRLRQDGTLHGDYLPSIGIVSRDARGGGREAEEMSEPGSPTIPVAVLNHKVPEENDHSTKNL